MLRLFFTPRTMSGLPPPHCATTVPPLIAVPDERNAAVAVSLAASTALTGRGELLEPAEDEPLLVVRRRRMSGANLRVHFKLRSELTSK
jgi:hypothetical protein